jgi:DNA-binding GntR family transcriptional regulator
VVERGSAEYPWRQLYRILRERIESGEYPAGGRLPSVRSLSEEYELASVTVRKALDQLREDRLIETAKGWGSFVRRDVADVLRLLRDQEPPRSGY